MRSLGSAFFVLFAIVLGILALPSAWVATQVIDEDGFVRLASPLSDDEAFTNALAGSLADEVTAAAHLTAEAGAAVEPIVADVARRIADLPGFDRAWDGTLRKSHQATFADPRTLSPDVDASSSFTLDIAPLVGVVVGEIGNQLGVEIGAPQQAFVNIGQANYRAVLDRAEAAASLWPVLAAAAAVGAVLGLVIARRRSVAFAFLGLGIALGAALLWFAAGQAPLLVDRTADANAVAGVFKDALTVRAVDSFQAWCLAGIAFGILALVAGIAGRVFSGGPGRA